MKKLPWGIFAGICAIVVFFATVGVVAAYLILNAIAGQTNATATLFQEWYQVLLLAVDCVFVVGFIGSVAMYVMKNKALAKKKTSKKK